MNQMSKMIQINYPINDYYSNNQQNHLAIVNNYALLKKMADEQKYSCVQLNPPLNRQTSNLNFMNCNYNGMYGVLATKNMIPFQNNNMF